MLGPFPDMPGRLVTLVHHLELASGSPGCSACLLGPQPWSWGQKGRGSWERAGPENRGDLGDARRKPFYPLTGQNLKSVQKRRWRKERSLGSGAFDYG